MAHSKSLKLRSLMNLSLAGGSLIALTIMASPAQAENLFGNPSAERSNPAAHIASDRDIKINAGALNKPVIDFNLDGKSISAVRTQIMRGKRGEVTWVGHIQGFPAQSVVITAQGNVFSGVIHTDQSVYEIAGKKNGTQKLSKINFSGLDLEDLGGVPQGGGVVSTQDVNISNENIVQDILVVYTQRACDAAAGQTGSDCSQLEADIVTTIAQMNQAYSDSAINITANIVDMRLINFADESESTSSALSKIRLTDDGFMDEVHGWRDELGADMVSLIMDGGGCGTAYAPASPSSAFNTTDESCMLGNRTLSHEIGHNQGALHDRDQHGGGTVGGYNYGFKRCSDGSDEDFGSPYFRTIMSYSCASAGRVGRYSNPNLTYLGVATGIDPDADPARGTFNARTLNESASYVAGFRTPPTVTEPPMTPSALSAVANGADAINLNWSDNADNEANYYVDRSTDNVNFTRIATLPANANSFTDNGLSANSTYYYRVEATNSAGGSGFSNIASATTDSLPESVDSLAVSQTSSAGTVTGSFTATHSDDGVVQTITEVSSGGPKRSRRQSYEHVYNFNVPGGAGGVMLSSNAWVSGAEGANFSYSEDGGSSWSQMFTVSDNSSSAMQSFVFPAETSGSLRVRITDAEQVNGEGADSVSIDSLIITSNTVAPSAPTSPSNLSVTSVSSSNVTLSFADNSDNEFGFNIWRGTSAGVCGTGDLVGTAAANATSFADEGVAAATQYYYDISAYNSGGESATCAGEVTVTTLIDPNITASANGYKVKGAQTVDLNWSGANGSAVDIRRNGSVIAQTSNDGSYTDNIGAKGGGSYSYQVCEGGSNTACSDTTNVIF